MDLISWGAWKYPNGILAFIALCFIIKVCAKELLYQRKLKKSNEPQIELKTQCVLCKSDNILTLKQSGIKSFTCENSTYYQCRDCGADYFIYLANPADIASSISFTNFPKQFDPYKNEVIQT